jgi:protein TonB
MDFEAWTQTTTDRERQRRLLAGYGVGALGVATLITLLSLASTGVAEEPPEEDVVDVKFATEPESEPEPEPEPEPEVKPEPQVQALRPAGPILPKLRPPTEVPDDKPTETEVKPDDNPYASGDPYMYGSGSGGVAKPQKQIVEVTPPPKPVAPAAPKGPIRVTEDVTAPEPLDQPQPEYPSSAKSAGISGTVVVKFVVTEAGLPTQVKAIKGPEELRSSCEQAVLGSKFKPASLQGKPVSVYRMRNCVFRLKT